MKETTVVSFSEVVKFEGYDSPVQMRVKVATLNYEYLHCITRISSDSLDNNMQLWSPWLPKSFEK